MFAACVIKVLPRGKKLNSLSPGSTRELQQPGVQTLIEKQMRGQNALHDRRAFRAGLKAELSQTLNSLSHPAFTYLEIDCCRQWCAAAICYARISKKLLDTGAELAYATDTAIPLLECVDRVLEV